MNIWISNKVCALDPASFGGASEHIYDIMTGDVSRISVDQPESKELSTT